MAAPRCGAQPRRERPLPPLLAAAAAAAAVATGLRAPWWVAGFTGLGPHRAPPGLAGPRRANSPPTAATVTGPPAAAFGGAAGSSLLLAAAAAAAAAAGAAGVRRLRALPRAAEGRPQRAAAAAEAAAAEGGAERRRVVLASLLGGVASCGSDAHAFELEKNRQAAYLNKAFQLNAAADWYLFDLRPLVYPAQELVARSDCEKLGERCPELAGLNVVSEWYRRPPTVRGGPNLSKPERDLITPLKTLATSAVFDPDTSDDLQGIVSDFERSCAKIESAARKGDIMETKKQYDAGREQMNKYFRQVNSATGLPENSEAFLQLLPGDGETLENDKYWQRRNNKYQVKKKVDAVSKGSKTARFYAKSIFGEDAVSWDPRGDRVDEFMMPEAKN